MTGNDWQRLAAYVVRRRREPDIGIDTTRALAKASGIGEKTTYKIERAELTAGAKLSRDTIDKLETTLGWAPGSVLAILAGGEPTPDKPGAAVDLAVARAEVIAMTPDELARMHARIRAVSGQEFADAWLRSAVELRKAAASQGSSSPNQTPREVG